MTKLIKLPKRFLIDHIERELPTPRIIKATKAHVWVELNDPAVPELLSDARYYDDVGWDMDPKNPGIAMSARATRRAIERAMQS